MCHGDDSGDDKRAGGPVNSATLERRLSSFGMSAPEVAAKAKLLLRCTGTLKTSDVDVLYVPGRIEFLGKHTDYCGGRSLLCAVEKGLIVAHVPRVNSTLRITDTSSEERIEFDIHPDLSPALGHWSNYPMTVARRLARNFSGLLQGADLAIASDLPRAAGLSSSSALVVAIYLALAGINGLSSRPEYQANIHSTEDLAGYLGTIENGQTYGALSGDRGVGTFGGSQDHTAILCCQQGKISQYSFCPIRSEGTIEWSSAYTLAIAVSSVVAEKTGQALELYNRASRSAFEILRLWRSTTSRPDATLADAVRSSLDAPEQIRSILSKSHSPDYPSAMLLSRFEQFFQESERIIPDVAATLLAGDLPSVGQFVDQSQYNAEHLLNNQVSETAFLAASARSLGARAASAFGAGFGGSVWALIPCADAKQFLSAWSNSFMARFPISASRASFFTSAPGIRVLVL